MKNIKRFIEFNWVTLWLLSGLLASCCPEADQKLDSAIVTWAPYQNNQKVVFKSENQDSVVFQVKQTSFTETGHDNVCGSYDIESLETVLVNQTDTAFQMNIVLTQRALVKLDSYYQQPATKNVSALFNSISEQYISHDWRDKYLKEISLNGKIYTNVLHIYGNDVPNNTSFIEIYYAKNVGLVAFTTGISHFYLK